MVCKSLQERKDENYAMYTRTCIKTILVNELPCNFKTHALHYKSVDTVNIMLVVRILIDLMPGYKGHKPLTMRIPHQTDDKVILLLTFHRRKTGSMYLAHFL